MGRYSPTVLPDFGGEGFANDLARAFDSYDTRKRRTQQDRERTEDRARAAETSDLSYFEHGGRRGTPPVERGRTVELPAEPNIPTSLDFSFDRQTPAAGPLDEDAFGQGFAQELASAGPSARANRQASPLETPQDFSTPARGLPAQRHPGAFDPNTRSFGGSPAQFQTAARAASRSVDLGPTGRYTPIDDSHYIDESATPSAERQADRLTQMQVAAAFRDNDIRTRNEGALSLEQLRQQGRQQLRDKINSAQVTQILMRGEQQGKNQAAHDSRVTTRQVSIGARPATAGQREANAMKAAEGVIAASQGDYNAAVDWLENTQEGGSAKTAGLERRHLYAALGKYEQNVTNRAVSLQTGTMGVEPAKAVENVTTTRSTVRGGKDPKSTPTASAAATDAAAREAWASKNPPTAGETREQYKARYEASKKPKP